MRGGEFVGQNRLGFIKVELATEQLARQRGLGTTGSSLWNVRLPGRRRKGVFEREGSGHGLGSTRRPLAVHTTLVSVVRRDGTRCANDGAAFESAKKGPTGAHGSRRSGWLCWLAIGGRWSEEAQDFVRNFARVKARGEPPHLRVRARQAWQLWTTLLACSARLPSHFLLEATRRFGCGWRHGHATRARGRCVNSGNKGARGTSGRLSGSVRVLNVLKVLGACNRLSFQRLSAH